MFCQCTTPGAISANYTNHLRTYWAHRSQLFRAANRPSCSHGDTKEQMLGGDLIVPHRWTKGFQIAPLLGWQTASSACVCTSSTSAPEQEHDYLIAVDFIERYARFATIVKDTTVKL